MSDSDPRRRAVPHLTLRSSSPRSRPGVVASATPRVDWPTDVLATSGAGVTWLSDADSCEVVVGGRRAQRMAGESVTARSFAEVCGPHSFFEPSTWPVRFGHFFRTLEPISERRTMSATDWSQEYRETVDLTLGGDLETLQVDLSFEVITVDVSPWRVRTLRYRLLDSVDGRLFVDDGYLIAKEEGAVGWTRLLSLKTIGFVDRRIQNSPISSNWNYSTWWMHSDARPRSA